MAYLIKDENHWRILTVYKSNQCICGQTWQPVFNWFVHIFCDVIRCRRLCGPDTQPYIASYIPNYAQCKSKYHHQHTRWWCCSRKRFYQTEWYLKRKWKSSRDLYTYIDGLVQDRVNNGVTAVLHWAIDIFYGKRMAKLMPIYLSMHCNVKYKTLRI